MGSGLGELGSVRYVELVFPYLSGYRPFIAVYDDRGLRVVGGRNAVKVEVFGSNYAFVKGYFVGSRPYVLDVGVGGDGARFLPVLINHLLGRGFGGDGGVTLYVLEFRVPRNAIDVSVKFHREVRRCFYRVGHSWFGRELCFDVDKWREVFSRYDNAFLRVYPVRMSVSDALRIVDSVISAVRGRIEFLREDLKYELRAYRRVRLARLIDELSEVLRGWEEFRMALVSGNGDSGR